MPLCRASLVISAGVALASAMPGLAAEPSNAELLERIERLEQKNQQLEKALPGGRAGEKAPENVMPSKNAEFQSQGTQEQERTLQARRGITADVSLTAVAQRANDAATTDNTGESQLNYRADVSISLPAGKIGNAEGTIFGQLRMGQGNGLETLRPTFSGPNTTALPVNGDNGTARLVQAWYQADIPLSRGASRTSSGRDLTINFGKMDPFAFFDQNAAANDETRQFLNNVFVHNALLDAGGDTGADEYGFSPGLRLAYMNETRTSRAYGLSLGVFGAGTGAKFHKTFSSPFVIVQADTRRKFFGGREGNYRFYVWHNGQAAPYQNDVDPGREAHAGWGVSVDQRVGEAVTLFGRYGHETGGHVRFDRALALGAELGGDDWNRAGDALGLAWGGQHVSREFHDDSLTRDADGDGTPDFGYQASGTEVVTEIYYRYRLNKHIDLTPDVQRIQRPGGDGTAAGMSIVGARAQATF